MSDKKSRTKAIFVVMTAAELISRYVWLADTIKRNDGGLRIEDIQDRYRQKWSEELTARTFYRYKKAIKKIFGICVCPVSLGDGYYYRIDKKESEPAAEWVLDSLSAGAMFAGAQDLRDRILLENVPSGQTFLEPVLTAMREGEIVELTHESFFRKKPRSYCVEPWCVKLFQQRWYLVGRLEGREDMRTFGLDRVVALEQTGRKFKMPRGADPQKLFDDCYGIIIGDNDFGVVPVALRVEAHQAKYLESLPLHHSQVRVWSDDEFTIFEMRLCPAFDFRQKLLSMGDTVEVLAPRKLRDMMRDMAYSGDDDPGEYKFRFYKT